LVDCDNEAPGRTGDNSTHLWKNSREHNRALLASLKNVECGDELLELTKNDVAMMRMANIEVVDNSDGVNYLLAPRFAVQQEKANGATKNQTR
jgi:hypothetical protein